MHAIESFNNHLPVKVKFGEGISTALPVVVDELGASKVFLMVDAGIEKFNPAVKALIDRLVAISHLTKKYHSCLIKRNFHILFFT
jgi:alcohol dehydrogenase